MRPYIRHLRTTVKTVGHREIELGRRTLIVGDNASGKSTVTQSLQLLAAKSADGIDGRTGVKDKRLLRLTSNPTGIEVVGDFDTGHTAKFTMTGGRGSGGYGADESNVLPVRAVRTVLQGGEDAAREAFLRWCTSGITESKVLAIIPTDSHALYRQVTRPIKGSAVDKMLGAADTLGKLINETRANAKAADAAVEGAALPAMPVTEEDVSEARRAVTAAEQNREVHARRTEALAAKEELAIIEENVAGYRATLNRLDDQIRALDSQIAARVAAIRPATPQPEFDYEVTRGIAIALETAVRQQETACPCCNSDIGHDELVAVRDWWDLAAAGDDFDPSTDAEYRRFDELRTADKCQRDSVQRDLDAATRRETYLRQRLFTLDYDPDTDEIPAANLDAADRGLAAARSALESVIADRAAWATVERQRDAARAYKKQLAEYQSLDAAIRDATAKILDASVADFNAAVAERLNGWRFTLTAKPFSWAVDKGDGRNHEALSGTEFERVLLALADVIASRGDYAGWTLLQPEDRMWDPEALAQTMEALSSTDCQVVIESTVEPARVPAGWAVLRAEEIREVLPEKPAETAAVTECQLSPAVLAYLAALGYPEDVRLTMSREEATEIMKEGRSYA